MATASYSGPERRYQGPERRKFKRLRKPLSLRLQAKAGGAFAEWDIIFIKDISRLGLSFSYDKPLKKDTLLNLKINLGLEYGTVQCVGKVSRVNELGAAKKQEVGVVFAEISESDGALIDRAATDFYAK